MTKTNLRCLLQTVPQPIFASAALLLLRLVVGAAFVFHGWGKIQTPFGWNPPESPIFIPVFGGNLGVRWGDCLDTGALDSDRVTGNRVHHGGGRLLSLDCHGGSIREYDGRILIRAGLGLFRYFHSNPGIGAWKVLVRQ